MQINGTLESGFYVIAAGWAILFVATQALLRAARLLIAERAGRPRPAPPKFVCCGRLLDPWEALARAMWFARLNLWLVALSVATTTLFYVAFVLLMLLPLQADSITANDLEVRSRLFFLSWLFDSLFNDVCILFVSFGPMADALGALGAAVGAEIVGKSAEEAPDQA